MKMEDAGRIEYLYQLPTFREPPPRTLMTQWVIYDHPSDQPEHYVLRATFILEGGELRPDMRAWAHHDVEMLRKVLPPGLTRLPRFPDDDPVILEVWL